MIHSLSYEANPFIYRLGGILLANQIWYQKQVADGN